MLESLSIRDVVLIERLDLSFAANLSVLTGETGAGKSILLDALGLALGQRAEARLVRSGCDRSVVVATFTIAENHVIFNVLCEQGIDADDPGVVMLKRILNSDGRSKAFINDQPVSVSLLKSVGSMLVEIHGQFESQRLLSPSMHQGLLDAYGSKSDALIQTSTTYNHWRHIVGQLTQLKTDIEAAREDEDYLRHALSELHELAPVEGEETLLSQQRQQMIHGEKLIEAIGKSQSLITGHRQGEDKLSSAIRELEMVADKADGKLDPVIAAFDRASEEMAEGLNLLTRFHDDLDIDPGTLENAEERLFALRALARKHRCQVDELAGFAERMEQRLQAVDNSEARLQALIASEQNARDDYINVSGKLGQIRHENGDALSNAVDGELDALKLGKARFFVVIDELVENNWNEFGRESVQFQVQTNPGAAPGPIQKIASGGEMARFMLALKAVLADADNIPTLVFDEVDAGIGGAVASAVGERLSKLANTAQVLVVTHSPQVAARGQHHLNISKSANGDKVNTHVALLQKNGRSEEIARMLAGSQVTDEARAAAERLLAG